jgi:hypothetical protein
MTTSASQVQAALRNKNNLMDVIAMCHSSIRCDTFHGDGSGKSKNHHEFACP